MSALRVRQLAGLVLALAATLGGQPPRVRHFHLEYRATVKDIPPEVKRVDLWIPVPRSDAWQRIRNLRIESASRYEITTSALGNTMLHAVLDRSASFTMSLDAAREERRLSDSPAPAREENPAEIERSLKPDRLVPLDGQIRAWARDVVAKANAHTDLEMARAIYDHVVATVKYDKTGKGWGRGDIYYACQERRGNCTDFHAVFTGYARALGIPARFAIGIPLPAGRGAGTISGYHCWAEFYAKGIGWVPVDASEAAKNPSKREYFFGAHDENRLEFTRGRDILLEPRQAGQPLNYFIYPYAEAGGKPFDGVEYQMTWRDE